MNAFIVSLEQAVLKLAQGEIDAEISAGQHDRAAQGWPFRTESSEASLITHHPSRPLHFLSSSVNSAPVSISASPSPFPLSLSLPVCPPPPLSLLIKQGQTGFVSLIQTEGVNMSLMLEKRHGRQENRSQVSEG